MRLPALVVLLSFLVLIFSSGVGCTAWRPVPATDITSDEAATLKGKVVRFYTDNGVVSMEVKKVDFPFVEGVEGERLGVSRPEDLPWVRLDLHDVNRMEIFDTHIRRPTVVSIVGAVLLVGIVVALIAYGWSQQGPWLD
jgi:hypothetical protein